MTSPHKNKTFATLLAAVLGGFGVHRFYLRGAKDPWGWLHFATAPISLAAVLNRGDQPALFVGGLFVLSFLIALIEALVLGLLADEQWDARFNPGSDRVSASGWPLALLLVLTTGSGAIALIFIIARSFDLLFTGGAYG
jgi:hypothetical protein